MSQLDTGPARKEYPPRAIYDLLQLIEQAINYLDTTNFPNQVAGTIIKSGTLSGAALKDYEASLRKLNWREFIIFSTSAIPVYSTTSTDGANVGPYFAWDPSKFPTGSGSWYIEASISNANASGITTVTLRGASEVGSVQTSATTLTRVRSAALVMPTTAQNLWFGLKTNSASYAAVFAGAHLIYMP